MSQCCAAAQEARPAACCQMAGASQRLAPHQAFQVAEAAPPHPQRQLLRLLLLRQLLPLRQLRQLLPLQLLHLRRPGLHR